MFDVSSTSLWPAVTLGGAGLALMAAGVHVGVLGPRRALRMRLMEVVGGGQREHMPGLRERALRPLGTAAARQIGRLAPEALRTALAEALVQAGRRSDRTDVVLLGRVVMALGGLALGGVAGVAAGLPLVLTAFGMMFGFLIASLVPSMALTQAIERRRTAIRKALPDTLDLLVTTVEAGLGFEAALTRVSQDRSDPLSEEIRLALSRMRYGATRSEALRELGRRTGVEDVQRFAAAVAQADELGTSMGGVLRAQSQLLRRLRLLRTEEAAAKIPVKMLFPMVMFILPGLFLMVLGPAVLRALSLGIFR